MPDPKPASNHDLAFEACNQYKDQPHCWIQWKGTSVCMDLNCRCGTQSHIDAEFTYRVKCPSCGTVYFCSGFIELIPDADGPEWKHHCPPVEGKDLRREIDDELE